MIQKHNSLPCYCLISSSSRDLFSECLKKKKEEEEGKEEEKGKEEEEGKEKKDEYVYPGKPLQHEDGPPGGPAAPIQSSLPSPPPFMLVLIHTPG